jgi:hypothetical protein
LRWFWKQPGERIRDGSVSWELEQKKQNQHDTQQLEPIEGIIPGVGVARVFPAKGGAGQHAHEDGSTQGYYKFLLFGRHGPTFFEISKALVLSITV